MKMSCRVVCAFDPGPACLLQSRSFNWEILLVNQAVPWDPSLTPSVEKHVVILNFSTVRGAAVGESISTEWFMQLRLLVVFSEMKKMLICFSTFWKGHVFIAEGQITHLDVFLYGLFLFFFFCFSGNKDQLCPAGDKRYVGLFFSCIAQYPWCKSCSGDTTWLQLLFKEQASSFFFLPV